MARMTTDRRDRVGFRAGSVTAARPARVQSKQLPRLRERFLFKGENIVRHDYFADVVVMNLSGRDGDRATATVMR